MTRGLAITLWTLLCCGLVNGQERLKADSAQPGLRPDSQAPGKNLLKGKWNTQYVVNNKAIAAEVTTNGDSGSYVLKGGQRGELSNIQLSNDGGSFSIHGNWSALGENGRFTWNLAEDQNSFTGNWSSLDAGRFGTWSGKRVLAGGVDPDGGRADPNGGGVDPNGGGVKPETVHPNIRGRRCYPPYQPPVWVPVIIRNCHGGYTRIWIRQR